MLFDLRGRGRRRTVQVIYLGLALIFLIGFVGFGVGVGGGGGGIISAITGEKGTSGASFQGQVNAALKKTRHEPRNPAAWAALAEAQLHQASEAEYYEQAGEQYTGKGKEQLNKVARSWSTYLALEPHNPSTTLAQLMVSVFGEKALNQPAEALEALEIVIANRPPSAALYGALAEYAYKAHNTRQGDLAAQKSVSLAPANERKRVKSELEAVKQNPNATPGASGGAVPSGSYTTTVGGKTTVLKSNGKGSLTSTSATSATPPAGHTTSTKK
jgi:hypothetical protein